MHLVYPPEFCITIVSNSTGYYSRPMRNPRRWLCKVYGDKQGALWSMWKWWIAFLKETIALYFALHLIKIKVLNEECTRDCFFVEFGRKWPKNKPFFRAEQQLFTCITHFRTFPWRPQLWNYDVLLSFVDVNLYLNISRLAIGVPSRKTSSQIKF